MIKEIIKNIFKKTKNHNKFFLFTWIILTKNIIKLIIFFYIFIHIISIIKLFLLFFSKNKNIINKGFVNKNLIKILILFNKKKTIKEKKNIIYNIFLGYLIIFLFNFSLKSIILSIDLYENIKISILTKENILLGIKETIIKEFEIKELNHSLKINFLRKEITIFF